MLLPVSPLEKRRARCVWSGKGRFLVCWKLDQVELCVLRRLHRCQLLVEGDAFFIRLQPDLVCALPPDPLHDQLVSPDNLDLGRLEELIEEAGTRAQEELVFSYAHQRMLMGQVTGSDMSRFIREIPEEVMADALPKRRRASADTQWRRDFQPRRTSSMATFRPAEKVFHEQFGQGIVLNCTGSGPEEVVTVAFAGNGVKKLQVSFANLRRV